MIRVFYGALREDICVAELRAPVGSQVVLGAFTPNRALRVLDLGALGRIGEYADLFHPDYKALSERLEFTQRGGRDFASHPAARRGT